MGKKIFISFAIEDQFSRNNLVHQAQQSHTPFDFVDMSVRKPWDSSWKTNCRAKIKQCDGVIAMISDRTYSADGARWEINCAYEENIPVLPIYIHRSGARRIPELNGKTIYYWTWDNVSRFLNSL